MASLRAPKIDLTIRLYLEQRPEKDEVICIIGEGTLDFK